MMSRSEDGFALVMAMVAAGLFAYLCVFIIDVNRGDSAMVSARIARARLEQAAQSGLAITLHKLGQSEQAGRWPVDGRPRTLTVDGTVLSVTIEDERGKVPMNGADEIVLRRLFTAIGLPPGKEDALAAAIMDWIDDDDAPRMHGAEAQQYRAAKAGTLPRNGKFRTLDELLAVRGMTPDIYARVAPAVTLFFGEPASFNPNTASPVAIMAMLGKTKDAAEVSARQDNELPQSRPALEISDDAPLTGRPLTVRVQADGFGGRIERTTIIQLTGDPARPIWIRAYH